MSIIRAEKNTKKTLSAIDIELAIARFFDYRQNIIVPEYILGDGIA